MNLPNKLTILRLIMIPVFVAIFYISAIPYRFIISAAVFALAAFTDFLDGYIARKYNMVTDFGKFLDPIADKVLVATALIVLLVPSGSAAIFPVRAFNWVAPVCVAIILARELIISGFRLVAAGKGLVIAADLSGKIKTFVTDIAIVFTLVAADISVYDFDVTNIIGLCLLVASAILTVVSGVECFVKNKSVISSK